LARLGQLFGDRIQINCILIVVSLVSIFVLPSQSAASWPTYLLALAILATARAWREAWRVPMLWLVVALLGWLTLSSLWSEPFDGRGVLSVAVRALLTFCFVVALAECMRDQRLRLWLGRALVGAGGGAVLAALWIHLQAPPPDGRLNGLGQLDTQVVAALVWGVVLIFALERALVDPQGAWRALGVVSALVAAYAVYLTGSRNAWVSVSIGAGVFLLAHRVRDTRQFIAAAGALAVILGTLVAGLIANGASREHVLPRGDSFRPGIWAAIVERIANDGSWFGLGINTSNNVIVDDLEFLHPHNLYLSVWYQGGIVAFALLVVLLAMTVRQLARDYRLPEAKLALAVLGVALPAYVLDGQHVIDKIGMTWIVLWLPIAIALGAAWSGHRVMRCASGRADD
jgi:O-antigen ligase